MFPTPGAYKYASASGSYTSLRTYSFCLSNRAVRTLGAVQRIYAEDTRNAGRLLSAYALKTPLVSCHSRNEISRASEVVDAIMQGMAIAVVSDAGTPGISDPGTQRPADLGCSWNTVFSDISETSLLRVSFAALALVALCPCKVQRW